MFLGTLYAYQQTAHDLIVGRRAALIAFSMGLGKTPTSIAAVESLMGANQIVEPGIVLTLSSLKYQWAKSIQQFSDSTPLVIDGTPAQRAKQYAQARDWMTSGVDYVVMNYETFVNDYKQIEKDLPRGFLIMDECTALKSFTSKRHKLVKKFAARVDVKVGLTGTPMTNGKPEEVFAQLLCIDPTVLGNFRRFDERYIERNWNGWVTGYRNLPELHQRLGEVMISKQQDDPDVAPYLPKTIYKQPLLVPLDAAGKAVYRRIANDLLADLAEAQGLFGGSFDVSAHYGHGSDQGGPADEMRGKIVAKVTALRMLCSHPELLRTSAEDFRQLTGRGSQYLYELDEEGVLDRLGKSPKVEALVRYVNEFLDQDPANKAVIFSTFVATLPLIQQALARHGSVTYSGQMNAKQKEAARTQFQTDPATRLFISSDAGGFGVDLPQANLLINYDLPWASGAARQRNGRVQRASSQWEHVVVQNLLIDGSLEIRQWDTLQQKNRIEAAVVEGRGIDAHGGLALTVGSLRQYLQELSL